MPRGPPPPCWGSTSRTLLAVQILLGLLAIALPIALYVGFASRGDLRPSSPRSVVATFALGALAFVPAEFLERTLTSLLGLRRLGTGTIDLAGIVYAYLVAAPLEEGLKVAAATPAFRLRVGQHRPMDGMSYAATAALGFTTAQGVLFLVGRPFSWIDPARAAMTALAAMCLATWWGYTLGRYRQGRMGGGWFNGAWVCAAGGNAIAHHLAFARGPTALLATIPILAVAAGLAWAGGRDVLQRNAEKAKVEPREPRKPRLLPIAPPSLRAIREALKRSERPISFFWIVLGMLVTTGVITAMLVGAVMLGRRFGFEFAAIDRDASQANAIGPLLLLASAALLAFLFAGWIVARASAARSVFEPAISALLAIGGALVLLGLAAPVAVVIALACAPFAFGLACLGAWLGLSDG